ncbi:periplasmic heavy metal sensor [Novosphingobium rosa]|uniref:periplasmic heavy metal sensor n=1 Tax=Novosphingobium rosa TaxID=76978 RepID=UPI000837199D|nr:periplasmic heavy metal sensor [Novosphingobium rosa]
MSPRSLRIVLLVSILLNIFLVAGGIAAFTRLQLKAPMIGAGAMRIAGADLPREERKALRQTLRAARKEVQPMVQDNRSRRDEAAQLLSAPVVDQPALLAALQKVREGDVALRAHVEERAVPFIATLPQADRVKLAESLQRRGMLKKAAP